ncbi:MAG: hypothetical protein KAI84_11805 [Gammaproteobacteria bacterium]|nr:hypothetical protein [Gammaproteobacteria bacterium]
MYRGLDAQQGAGDGLEQGAGDGLGKAVPLFERQYLTGSFYLYHSFSVIVAQPLSLVDRTVTPLAIGDTIYDS